MTFKAIPILQIAVGLALVSRYPCICCKIFKKKNGYKLDKTRKVRNLWTI